MADLGERDPFNPTAEIHFTEGNQGNEGKRLSVGNDPDTKSSGCETPTPSCFVHFVCFCKSASVFGFKTNSLPEESSLNPLARCSSGIINRRFAPSPGYRGQTSSKRKPNGDQQGSRRVEGSWVQIVSILNPDRTERRPPPDATSD